MDNVLVLGNDVDQVLDQTSDWEFVGSRVTCDPVPPDADLDILCLAVSSKFHDAVDRLQDIGFETGGSAGSLGHATFVSLRRNEINVILTGNAKFYEKFLLATNVAKRLNLLKKEDRIILFRAILYGV